VEVTIHTPSIVRGGTFVCAVAVTDPKSTTAATMGIAATSFERTSFKFMESSLAAQTVPLPATAGKRLEATRTLRRPTSLDVVTRGPDPRRSH
jgi:hypothetical protein